MEVAQSDAAAAIDWLRSETYRSYERPEDEVTGNPSDDFEVTGTHLGLAFNPAVYRIIADRLAESRLDLVRWNPHPGVDQPDVAPGAAMPRAMGFEHTDALALFQQMQRRRQSGEPGADHADIDFDLAPERRVIRSLRREFFPQTFFA